MNLDQHGAVPKVEQPTKEDHILAKDSSKSRLKTQDQEIKWKQHSSILRHEVHQSRHNALRLEFVVLLPLANLPAPYSVCYQWPHFGRYSRKAATGWNDMPAAPSAHHRAWTKAYRSNKVLSKSIQKSYCSVTRLFQAVSSRFKLLSTFNLFDRALGTLPASDETSKPVRTISWATQAATVWQVQHSLQVQHCVFRHIQNISECMQMV